MSKRKKSGQSLRGRRHARLDNSKDEARLFGLPFRFPQRRGSSQGTERRQLHNSRSAVYRAWPFAIRSIANCKIEANSWRQREVSRDRHTHPIGERINISALQRLFPHTATGKPYRPANLEEVIKAIEKSYEHDAGDDGELDANSDAAPKPAIDLPIVDWDGHDIPKHGPRADRLRQLLARRARDPAPMPSPGALQRA